MKDILKENRHAAGRSPRGSCSCTTMLRLTGHLQPRRNRCIWASSVLITHPILRIWPLRTTTCSLDWKNNWKVVIFRPTRRPGWTDILLNFFEWFAKFRSTGWEVYWNSWGVPISRPIRRTFFPKNVTYIRPASYAPRVSIISELINTRTYITSLSWDNAICFQIMRSGITDFERLAFLCG